MYKEETAADVITAPHLVAELAIACREQKTNGTMAAGIPVDNGLVEEEESTIEVSVLIAQSVTRSTCRHVGWCSKR